MNEEFIAYLWSQRLLHNNLRTYCGKDLMIRRPGSRNHDSGPDFFNAMVDIGSQTWAGNVEVHLRASDWDRHGHSRDEAYDNVILHVVYHCDREINRKDGSNIPCLELKGQFDESMAETYRGFMSARTWIACQNMISSVGHFDLHAWYATLAVERLEMKSDEIMEGLKANSYDFQEAFYQSLARSFGFATNATAFALLAAGLPLKVLAAHTDRPLQVEALLFGQAGMLQAEFADDYPNSLKREFLFLRHKHRLNPIDKKLWKFMRLRPPNFPTVRIAQLASLIVGSQGMLTKMLEADRLSTVEGLLQATASAYWYDHYRFDKGSSRKQNKRLGRSSVELLLINTVLPFMFTYGKLNSMPHLSERALEWLEKLRPEGNKITFNFNRIGVKAGNAFQSQALVQLYKNYCRRGRCLECRIGHKLIRSQ